MTLREWLDAKGFHFLHPKLDNRYRRFLLPGERKAHCWYIGSEYVTSTGERQEIITVGTFRGDFEPIHFRTNGISKEADFEILKITKERAEHEQQQQLQTQRACAISARDFWEKVKDSPRQEHAYLSRKQIPHMPDISIVGTELYVPMRSVEGEIWGIQTIKADGTKRFLPGQKTTGLLHFVGGEYGDLKKIILTEGYATGVSLYTAQRNKLPVCVVFTAGNIRAVCEALKERFPNTTIYIFADDDRWKKRNTGREKALEAGSTYSCPVIFPRFSETLTEHKPTDFNDLHVHCGLDEVKKQLEEALMNSANMNIPESGIPNPCIPNHDIKSPHDVVSPPPKPPGGPSKEKDEFNKEELAHEILDCRFKLYVDNHTTILYNITNIKKKEVDICLNDEMLLRRLKQNVLEKTGKSKSDKYIKAMYTNWRLTTQALPTPPLPFTWSTQDEWSFKKLDFEPMEGKFDAWEEFLERLSSREDFMAFIWSVFEIKNTSRQFLYLTDPAGEGGKTTIIGLLANVFGKSFGALNNSNTSGPAQRWLLGELYGKRLAAWGDCKNPKFCMTEVVRNITSGDWVTVEFKGRAPFAARMYMKLIIGSNHEPQISSGGADMSRLINIHVRENTKSKDDPTWKERLEKEFPHFLYACKKYYEEKCPNHGKIVLSESTKDNVENATSQIEGKFEKYTEANFVFGKFEEMTGSEWVTFCEEKHLNDNEIGNLKDYLRRHHGVSFLRKRNEAGKKVMKVLGATLRKVPF